MIGLLASFAVCLGIWVGVSLVVTIALAVVRRRYEIRQAVWTAARTVAADLSCASSRNPQVPLGARPPAASEGTLSGGSTPSEGEEGAHPVGEIRGEPPLAASYPPQGVPRPLLRFMAEQVEATKYEDEVQP